MIRHRSFRRSRQGSILMVTVCIGIIIGVVLIACLNLVKSQNQAVVRSQAWNACMPVLEAGIEEAMAHLNNPNNVSFAVNGWAQTGDVYSRYRALNNDFYLVNLFMSNMYQPVIVCTGYVRAPVLVAEANHALCAAAGVYVGGVQYVSRTVQVVTRKRPTFSKAMVAKDRIQMNGNNIETDSFDSSDPNYCTTNGLYDPTKAKDNGDVATVSGLMNSIGIANANIKGHMSTGPGGSATVGPNGVVGSMAWHLGGNTGVEPGWFTDDMNVYFPEVEKPWNGGAFAPGSGTVTGVVYKYLLTGGNYELGSLSLSSSEKMAVTGNAVLYVTGSLDVKGGIDILPGGSLTLYVAAKDAVIGGTGVNNTGKAGNFIYLGLPQNKTLGLPSNGDFVGAIYAPNMAFTLSGGGSTSLHFVGACVTKTISVNGHYKFHYDEALRSLGPWKNYTIISWLEL
jgi:hypothetical protein